MVEVVVDVVVGAGASVVGAAVLAGTVVGAGVVVVGVVSVGAVELDEAGTVLEVTMVSGAPLASESPHADITRAVATAKAVILFLGKSDPMGATTGHVGRTMSSCRP